MRALLLVLVGCALPPERFAEERELALCTVEVDCFSLYDAVDDCLGTPVIDDCEGYDVDAARACVAALEAMAEMCPADLMDFVNPEPCERVCP